MAQSEASFLVLQSWPFSKGLRKCLLSQNLYACKALLFKVWSSDPQHQQPLELVGNANSQASPSSDSESAFNKLPG